MRGKATKREDTCRSTANRQLTCRRRTIAPFITVVHTRKTETLERACVQWQQLPETVGLLLRQVC